MTLVIAIHAGTMATRTRTTHHDSLIHHSRDPDGRCFVLQALVSVTTADVLCWENSLTFPSILLLLYPVLRDLLSKTYFSSQFA